MSNITQINLNSLLSMEDEELEKTSLIQEFIKNKEALFFTGLETTQKQNLINLSQVILQSNSEKYLL